MGHSLIVSNTQAGREGVLSLMGNLTMVEAQDTKKALLEAIEEVDRLHLDLKSIESIDVSFIQLLCAAHRECFLSKKEIFLQGDVPGDIEEFLERAGYSKQHGCFSGALASCLWRTCDGNH